MPAPFIGTEHYVDPSLNSNTGDGTIGNPYGDLEYGISQMTFNTADGSRVNIKAGGTEILAASLDVAIAARGWATQLTAPLVFQGYTTAAGDGGRGSISGGGAVSIYVANQSYVHFLDLELHNTGANPIMRMAASQCSIVRCEIHNSTDTDDNVRMGIGTRFVNNFVYDHAGLNEFADNCFVAWNRFENGAVNKFITAIRTSGTQFIVVERNIVKIDGSTDGILADVNNGVYISNNVWSNGGTGRGFYQANGKHPAVFLNNQAEGFSGAGGHGFDLDANNSTILHFCGNGAFNCDTEFSGPDTGDILLEVGWGSTVDSNDSHVLSPFADAANSDFAPVDTGRNKEGHLPNAFLE